MLQQMVDVKLAGTSILSALSSVLFGVEAAVVLMAFSGGLAALSISTQDRNVLQACIFVLLSSVTGSVGASGISFVLPGFPERLSAFIIGLIALPLLVGAVNIASTLPEKVRDKWLS